MIRREQVIGMLLEACPSYHARWKACREDPGFDAELLYVHLGDFADHVIDLLSRDDRAELGALTRAVERLHVDGDEYVKEAATIGLLEGIQNIASIEVYLPRGSKQRSALRRASGGAVSTPSGQGRFRTSERTS